MVFTNTPVKLYLNIFKYTIRVHIIYMLHLQTTHRQHLCSSSGNSYSALQLAESFFSQRLSSHQAAARSRGERKRYQEGSHTPHAHRL